MKLVPLVAPLPLSNATKLASLGDEETRNELLPYWSGWAVQWTTTPFAGIVSGASVESPFPENFWPVEEGATMTVTDRTDVTGLTRLAHTFVPCTFLQWPGERKIVRRA